MTRADVRRQTNHQNDGLQKHPHNLDGNDDGHHKQRHTWGPKQVAPVMLVSIEGCDQENQRRQHHGDAQSACHVESSDEWNQSQQVGEEDEEEHRHEEGQELVCLRFSDVGNGDFVTEEHHQGFQSVGHSRGRLTLTVLVASGHAAKQHNHQSQHEKHAEDGFGDAQIVHHWAVVVVFCVIVAFVRTMIVTSVVRVVVTVVRTMVMTGMVACHRDVPVTQLVRHPGWSLRDATIAVALKCTAHEHIQAMLGGVDNDGQRNVHVSPQVDLVGIGNVMDDEVARIERLLFMAVVVAVFSPCRCGRRGDQQSEEECNTLVHGCKSAAKVLTKAVFCTIEISSFDFGPQTPPLLPQSPLCKGQTRQTQRTQIPTAPPR